MWKLFATVEGIMHWPKLGFWEKRQKRLMQGAETSPVRSQASPSEETSVMKIIKATR